MSEQPSTPDRILNAAEKLFAERGIAGVSLRSIISEAGVNIAAIHYHFGSKEELVRAVFHRRLSHVNEQREQSLIDLQDQFGELPIPLEQLLKAFLAPVLELGKDSRGGSDFFRVAARAHADPDPVVRNVLYSQLRDVVGLYLKELSRTLPHLPVDELTLRFSFMAGAMVQAVLMPYREFFSNEVSDESLRGERMLEMLVRFCVSGFEGEELKR